MSVEEYGRFAPNTPASNHNNAAVVPLKDVHSLGDPRFFALLDEMRSLHARKSADYGTGTDPLANLRASTQIGIDPWVGVILRLSDKMFRVYSLIKNGSLANESIEENLIDMASYPLLALILKREQDESK